MTYSRAVWFDWKIFLEYAFLTSMVQTHLKAFPKNRPCLILGMTSLCSHIEADVLKVVTYKIIDRPSELSISTFADNDSHLKVEYPMKAV